MPLAAQPARQTDARQAGTRPGHIRLVRDRTSGVEALHARFAGHAYDLHRHDDWLVGVTDRHPWMPATREVLTTQRTKGDPLRGYLLSVAVEIPWCALRGLPNHEPVKSSFASGCPGRRHLPVCGGSSPTHRRCRPRFEAN
jgi:hypothetical protein